MATEKRLIDANALRETVTTDYYEHFTRYHDTDQIALVDMVCEAIEEAPTVDAVEVVHGHWDEIPNKYMSVSAKNGSYSGHATSCSFCHEVNPNVFKTNYCPNCGAKMDGERRTDD